MGAPWYTYIIALVVGAPVFFLWIVGAYLAVKALMGWVSMPEMPVGPVPVAPSGRNLKG